MNGMYKVNSDKVIDGDANKQKDTDTIDFFILDPDYKVLVSKKNSKTGVFSFNTKMAGQYSFVISNQKDGSKSKSVAF